MMISGENYRDMPIQEAVLMAPAVVASIIADLDGQKFEDPQEHRDRVVQCEDALRWMSSMMKAADILIEHDFKVEGLAELREAMVSMRFTLCDLLDVASSATRPPDSKIEDTSPQDFAVLVNDLPPAPRWYEENFDALRGPRSGWE